MDPNISKKLDDFFNKYKEKKFKRRELFIKAEVEPPGLFYLKNGLVKQYAITREGDELTINLFKSPSLFPMGWLLNGTPNHHYFEAMTEVTTFIAPRKDVLNFLKEEPDILIDLVKRIYRGLDGYFMRMENMMSGTAQKRLITDIAIYGKRFGVVIGNSMQINFKLTERDLASQTGIARETVSREIQKLQEKGLITFKKNILVINDINKLENE